MVKNSILISIICEGLMEWELITNIKTIIIDCKYIKFCKQHSRKGPSYIDDVHKFYNDDVCCLTQFIIFDKDKREQDFIEGLKNKYGNEKIIVTYPCLELVLLNIFKQTTSGNISKKELEDQLTKELKKKNKSFEYKHSQNIVKIFINILRDKETYLKWKSNLKQLKQNGVSNFIDVIEFIENNKKGK